MKRHYRDSLSRKALKLLCLLLGLVLAVMLCATLAFQHILKQMNYVDPAPAQKGGSLSLRSAISLSNLGAGGRIGGAGSGILNILLIGQDAREGENQARSDSMILCTFHKETGKLTLTSFLRDLYVEIPGHSSNRINAAYSFGGTALLVQTLSHNFDLHIDGTVQVDFTQFSQVVDLLGGVTIQLRQDEADLINQETGSTLTEGTQLLNGAQALAYSRIRKLDIDGDFSRTDRQRKVMGALVDAYKDVQIKDLLPMLTKILPMITTDLNHGQILMCVLEVLPHLGETELSSQHIPASGAYEDRTIDGMSVLVADLEAAREQLRETLLNS